MRFQSLSLSALAGAVGQAQVEVGDTDLLVPPYVVPQFTLFKPVQNLLAAVGSATAPFGSSFCVGFSELLNNVGAGNNSFAIISAGLWRLRLFLTVATDFTLALAATPPLSINLVDPQTNVSTILAASYARTDNERTVDTFELLLQGNGWAIRRENQAIGAAQNLGYTVSLIGLKLLP